MMLQYVTDEEFGRVCVEVNAQARHLIARVKSDGLHVTVPPLTPLLSVRHMIDMHREDIRRMMAKAEATRTHIDFDFAIHTDLLTLRLEPVDIPAPVAGQGIRVQLTRQPGETVLGLPRALDFDHWQEPIHHFLLEQLRWQARAVLTPRIQQLAEKHGFTFNNLTFKKSRSNWGSCSVRGNINLSIFLMTLPSHLVDYVLLHELCHTHHQDHSPAFWALMDKVIGGSAKALQRELRAYRTQL